MRRLLLHLGALLAAASAGSAQQEYDVIPEDDPLRPVAPVEDAFHRWYASASVGWSNSGASAGDLESDLAAALPGAAGISSSGFDETDFGYRVAGGYRLDRTFSVELGFTDFGSIESSLEFQGSTQAEIEDAIRSEHPVMGSGVTLGGRAMVLQSQTLDLSVKAGGFFWQADNEFSVTIDNNAPTIITEDESGTDFYYGIGVHYLLDDAWSLQAEWDNYRVEDEWVSFLTVGARYDFDFGGAPPPRPATPAN